MYPPQHNQYKVLKRDLIRSFTPVKKFEVWTPEKFFAIEIDDLQPLTETAAITRPQTTYTSDRNQLQQLDLVAPKMQHPVYPMHSWTLKSYRTGMNNIEAKHLMSSANKISEAEHTVLHSSSPSPIPAPPLCPHSQPGFEH